VLSRIGIEASQAAQYVIAFVIILVVVALFGLVLRRLTGGRLMLPGQDRARARQPRLGIVDIYDLDRQRQLILLRRDNVEHLLLIGGPNDVVVETSIVRVPGARLPTPSPTETLVERADPAFERQAEPPRPQVEAARASLEAQLAARLGSIVPARPSDTSDAAEELAPVATASAPIGGRVEPTLKPDVVTPAPSAPSPSPRPSRGEPPIRRAEPAGPPLRSVPAAAEPPRAEPRPEPRSAGSDLRAMQAVPRPGTPQQRPAPAEARSAPPSPRPAPPAPENAPEPRGADAAVLSSMARQLEEALRRPTIPPPPASAPAPTPGEGNRGDRVPPPAQPASPPPRAASPVPSPPPRATVTASLAAPWPGTEPARRAAPPSQGGLEAAAVDAEPVREAPAKGEPQAGAGQPPAPERTAASPPPSPAPGAPAAPAEAANRSRPLDDPFSVEEIEAEFARLLGRPSGGDRT
jgi:flagellar protein FliO/FliZ